MSEPKWFVEERFGRLELTPSCDHEDVVVNIGSDHVVTVDKMYGPLSVDPLRIRIDYEAYEWVVEQDTGEDTVRWIERARIPCQE